jgi:hypothetical protein
MERKKDRDEKRNKEFGYLHEEGSETESKDKNKFEMLDLDDPEGSLFEDKSKKNMSENMSDSDHTVSTPMVEVAKTPVLSASSSTAEGGDHLNNELLDILKCHRPELLPHANNLIDSTRALASPYTMSKIGYRSSPIVISSSPLVGAGTGKHVLNPSWKRILDAKGNSEKDIRTTTVWWNRRARGERRIIVSRALQKFGGSKAPQIAPPSSSSKKHSTKVDATSGAAKFLKHTGLLVRTKDPEYLGAIILETANRLGQLRSLTPKWGLALLENSE